MIICRNTFSSFIGDGFSGCCIFSKSYFYIIYFHEIKNNNFIAQMSRNVTYMSDYLSQCQLYARRVQISGRFKMSFTHWPLFTILKNSELLFTVSHDEVSPKSLPSLLPTHCAVSIKTFIIKNGSCKQLY